MTIVESVGARTAQTSLIGVSRLVIVNATVRRISRDEGGLDRLADRIVKVLEN
jgi:hypothetical protein